jgi:carbon-monoxide dehydrogenase large subunit
MNAAHRGSIGSRVRRVEDEKLITGRGRFAGDVHLEGQTYLAVRRSHEPHALIRSIDVVGATAIPGVIAVFTQADLPEAARFVYDDFLPPDLAGLGRPVLAGYEVNYLGDAVAVVVAETPYAASDAAAAIEVDLEPLPAAGTMSAALEAGAPLVHENRGSNIALWGADGFGDVDAAFGPGAVIAADRLVMHRVCGAAIEPRAVAATSHGGGVKVWTSTQAVFVVRDRLAGYLGLETEQVEVLAENVGGGFGPKGRTYPEEVLVAWAAIKLGRPVKWTASRSEDSITSMHAHGTIFELEIAGNPDGTLRGLRGRFWHDIGAYPSIGVMTLSRILEHMLGAYRLPALGIEALAVFTNATPTSTIRGGGSTEGNFAVERMMDRLATKLGLEPAEVRRRNLLSPDALPYRTRFGASGAVLESGDFPGLLEAAVRRFGQSPTLRDGRLRGVGLAIGVEHTGGAFNGEPARVQIHPDGAVKVFLGSTPQGQGHQTMAAQIVADKLGWPIDRITVVTGDTRWLPNAGMTAASRSAVHVGNAVSLASTTARRTLLKHASDRMEIDPADLDLKDGVIGARGTPSIRWAAAEVVPPEGIDVIEAFYTRTAKTSPSSCHIAEVAVDAETGAVEVLRYLIVYDSGVEINPLIVEGQLQGGLAHGIGYALLEEAVFEPGGEFRTPTFVDYEIPSAPELANEPVLVSRATLTASNPEGIKGVGETGTTAAPAAIAAAVESAIREVAPNAMVSELPIRPSRVSELIDAGPDGSKDRLRLV